MKKLLLSLLATVCVSTSADTVPTDFSVIARLPTGVLPTLCRSVFAAYAREYKSNVNIVIKPGADGILAVEDVTSSDKFTVLCASSTELVFNFFEYPQHVKIHSDLQPTNILSTTIVSFTSSPTSKYQNLVELIADKKSITVGFAGSAHGFIAKKMFNEKQLVLVPFKAAQQAIPSLLDGTLDVYLSGGAFEELHRDGKLKPMGHLHGRPTSLGPALDQHFSEALKFPSFVALAVNKKTPPDVAREFSRRIALIMKTPEVQQTIQDLNGNYTPNTLQQATVFVEKIKTDAKKSY
jgi:tripartite-type tricarboxylate transporter receptor subunit TctC